MHALFRRRMAHFRVASFALFGLVALFLIAFGALYANVHEMLWFHAAAVPEAIRDEVRPLYFALMKLIGGASASLGLLAFWVIAGPLRRGARFAAEALVVALAIPLVTAAYVAEALAARTGSPTSWHIMGVLLAIVVAGYAAHRASGRSELVGLSAKASQGAAQ